MQATFIRFIIIAPLTVFAGFLVAVTYLRITLPDLLFGTPYATVLEDRSGELMGARIAADGQWRFPSGGEVPERLATAMLEFEDRHFYRHPGVNPFAIARAMRQNYRAGRVPLLPFRLMPRTCSTVLSLKDRAGACNPPSTDTCNAGRRRWLRSTVSAFLPTTSTTWPP
jgi:hypothetical protein